MKTYIIKRTPRHYFSNEGIVYSFTVVVKGLVLKTRLGYSSSENPSEFLINPSKTSQILHLVKAFRKTWRQTPKKFKHLLTQRFLQTLVGCTFLSPQNLAHVNSIISRVAKTEPDPDLLKEVVGLANSLPIFSLKRILVCRRNAVYSEFVPEGRKIQSRSSTNVYSTSTTSTEAEFMSRSKSGIICGLIPYSCRFKGHLHLTLPLSFDLEYPNTSNSVVADICARMIAIYVKGVKPSVFAAKSLLKGEKVLR